MPVLQSAQFMRVAAGDLLAKRAQRNDTSSAFPCNIGPSPEIADIYSKVVYPSRLLSDVSRHLEHRSRAQQNVEHIAATYGVSKLIIFFDIPQAVQDDQKQNSNFCRMYGNLVLKILEDLLVAGFGSKKPCKIAILTPYRLQQSKLRDTLRALAPVPGAAAVHDVDLETVDKVQKMEYDVVITNPAATHRPGFLRCRE